MRGFADAIEKTSFRWDSIQRYDVGIDAAFGGGGSEYARFDTQLREPVTKLLDVRRDAVGKLGCWPSWGNKRDFQGEACGDITIRGTVRTEF